MRLVFLGKFGPFAPAVLCVANPPPFVASLQDLRDWVSAQAPDLGAALAETPYKLIVNHAVVHDLSAHFRAGDEIAFMPPMSGG